MSTVVKTAVFIKEYLLANLSMAMEYRASFITQVFGMVLNDTLWIIFWWLFFDRFPVVAGWSYRELLLLYSVVTCGFGIGIGLMGNCTRLSAIIAEGHLDFYLVLPKNVLLHVLVSRMNISALGDLLFGVLVYLLSGAVSWLNTLLLIVASLLTAAMFVIFAVLVHSLSFYLGNASTLAGQLFNALITFSLYPSAIFRGMARLMLFTVLPAGFISLVPVMLLRDHKVIFLFIMIGAVLALGFLAIWLFNRGLRRYESGNLISIRV